MFLTTKLFMPPLVPGTVERERLYAALDTAWTAGTRLVLLTREDPPFKLPQLRAREMTFSPEEGQAFLVEEQGTICNYSAEWVR